MRAFLVGSLVVMTLLPLGRADDDDDKRSAMAEETGGAAGRKPAGELVPDQATGKAAVGSLPVAFVRSPDTGGPDGKGRYLIAVNSGYGVQFDAKTNRGQESLAVIDLNAEGGAAVVQNVYFPSPQSAAVGAAFGAADKDGAADLSVAGGFENKVWRFRFTPGATEPISPGSPGPNTRVSAPFVDVAGLTQEPTSKRYNHGKAAVYPLGLAAADGFVFTADNLGDSLGIITHGDAGKEVMSPVNLRQAPDENVYPYGVITCPGRREGAALRKVYVSLWNAAAVAVVTDAAGGFAVAGRIPTGSHPSAMVLDGAGKRLFVANANADSVSVIDTETDTEVERIDVRLADKELPGVSAEALALSGDGGTLYVALARADAVAVVRLGDRARGAKATEEEVMSSRLAGLIPAGRYPSALAVVGSRKPEAGNRKEGDTKEGKEKEKVEGQDEARTSEVLFVGNGKGTGTENSSNVVNFSGRNPNAPNAEFPASGKGHHQGKGGAYSVAVMSGNYSAVPVPDEEELRDMTAQVLRRQGLLGEKKETLFAGWKDGSPFKHVIYLIKENRTYDQVFGDLKTSGDGTPADGAAELAIFGAGEAARKAGGTAQDVTPNHHALAERFGLMDRFFVNSEASADGHNWSTAAFSTDYVDKTFRWNYSGRGRSYDFEGFNRLPDTGSTGGEPVFPPDVTADMVGAYLRRFVPYTHGGKDVGEPATLYLWDLAARAGRSYRTYGEFVASASADDLAAARARKEKAYPDVSPNVVSVPAKQDLEGHFCPAARDFDLDTPDALTVESYRTAEEGRRMKAEGGKAEAEERERKFDPMISAFNSDARWQGTSRMGAFLEEFRQDVKDLAAGKGDGLAALNVVRLSNDHTSGLAAGKPTAQFYVADNDYALGRLVEAVSHSAYWKDTAIVAVEDDAQDGPDHVDCHRSVALIISAYNRRGALVHGSHTTAGLIRTMELMLGLPPMNAQDAAAAPVDLFRKGEPDLTPFVAEWPTLDADGLLTPSPEAAPDKATAALIRRNERIDLKHPDDGDPRVLNAAIWASVRGAGAALPATAHLPVYDLLRSEVSATGASGVGDDD